MFDTLQKVSNNLKLALLNTFVALFQLLANVDFLLYNALNIDCLVAVTSDFPVSFRTV